MNSFSHKPAEPATMVRAPRVWRIAGWGALAIVLALAFVGYLTPDMRVQWANFVALCGF